MWVGIISSFTILIPLLIGIKFYQKCPEILRAFWFFILFSTLFESVVFYTFIKGINNLWLFKLFLSVDFLFFCWFFNKYSPFPVWKWILTISAAVIIISTELYIGISKAENSGSIFYITIFLFFIIQSGFMIIVTFDNFEVTTFKNFAFWIAFARLFYFLSILFIYIYANIAKDIYNNDFFKVANNITNAIANIILNTLYGVSFLCLRAKD